MNKYFKYLKALLYVFIPLFTATLFISLFYYLDIFNVKFNNYLLLINTFISMLIGGIYIGKKTKEKGYIEGLKIGIIAIFILFIFSIILKTNIIYKNIIYYIIMLSSSILGSMIGINKKKD